jgi:putative copper export protein
MVDAISTWLHVLAITIWVGPQVFLFAAAVPAVRTIEDAKQRAQVMRVLALRFGWLGWSAMAVIIVSGVINLFIVADDLPGYSAGDLVGSGLRYSRLFWEKMFFVGVALALTAVHTFFAGPRQLQLMEQASADERALRRARRWSMATSGVALLASIGALYMGAVLANHEYSFVVE